MSLDALKNILSITPLVAVFGISVSIPLVTKKLLSHTHIINYTITAVGIALVTAMPAWALTLKISDWSVQGIASWQLFNIEKKILHCDATLALYKQAKTAAYDTYRTHMHFKTIPNFAPQSSFSSNGEILLDSHLSESKMMTCTIFELANMSQSAEFKEIDDMAKRGTISQEDYARQSEHIEWKSILIALAVLKNVQHIEDCNIKAAPIATWQILSELPDDESRWKWTKLHMPEHVDHYYKQHTALRGKAISTILR